MSTSFGHSQAIHSAFFFLSEDDIILAFDDLWHNCGCTWVLGCGTCLSKCFVPGSANIYHFQVIFDTFSKVFSSLSCRGFALWRASAAECFEHRSSEQKPRMDYLRVVQPWVLKCFVPAGKWVLFTRSSCPSGERMNSGFFFTSWYLFLCLAHRGVSCKCCLCAIRPSKGRNRQATEGDTCCVKAKGGAVPKTLWQLWGTVQN